MSYYFDRWLSLAYSGWNMSTATITRIWVMEGSKVDENTTGAYQGLGQPSASDLPAIDTLNECNWSNYTRAVVPTPALAVNTNTRPHSLELTFGDVSATGLGTGTPVIGELWCWSSGGSTNATAQIPLIYFNNKGSNGFPFQGGRDVIGVDSTRGSIRLSL